MSAQSRFSNEPCPCLRFPTGTTSQARIAKPSLYWLGVDSSVWQTYRKAGNARGRRMRCGIRCGQGVGANSRRTVRSDGQPGFPNNVHRKPLLVACYLGFYSVAARLRRMRRWLAIILLAFVPFQVSWTAVASYCPHEPTTESSHLGHHEHQHNADLTQSADESAEEQKAPGSVDLDCVNCHGWSGAMPLPAAALLPPLNTSRPVPLVAVFEPAHAPSPPERPQWLSLA